jgi:hypothetical protein
VPFAAAGWAGYPIAYVGIFVILIFWVFYRQAAEKAPTQAEQTRPDSDDSTS